MRVGLFGGSFNPAHGGHAHVARTSMARLELDRVWWLVSPQNPLKDKTDTDALAQRMALTRRHADAPGFVVTDLESRLGARYTIDSLTAIVGRWPRVRFVWIMGADNLASFHLWRGWREIMALVPIAVVARPGAALAARFSPAAEAFARRRLPEEYAGWLADARPPAWIYLTAPLDPRSSTALRAARRR